MMVKTNINWLAMTDDAVLEEIGKFIRNQRILKNKTQEQVAIASGINRYTVSKIENGESVNLSSFIQILRTLDLLYLFDNFTVNQEISPLKAVKLQKETRKRVRNNVVKENPKSDW